jgi:serine/threonine protein kinase
MSERNYVHRDLKPDNIVLNFPGENLSGMRLDQHQLQECYQDVSNCEVKICDLGFVRSLQPGELSQSFDAGNQAHSAPEKLLEIGYDKMNEVWAIG